MKFLCGNCRTKYQISDDKVRGKILTIRCKKCGAKILVRESLAAGGGTAVAPVADDDSTVANRKALTNEQPQSTRAPSIAPSSFGATRTGGSAALASAYEVAMGQNASDSDDMPTSIAPVPANLDIAGVEWYVAIDGVQQGPFAFAEVVQKVEGRQLIGRHYVWHDGMENWQRLRDVPDLAKYLPTPRKVAPPPVPAEVQRPPAEVVELAARRAQLGQDLLDDATPAGPTKAAPSPRSARAEAPDGAETSERMPGRSSARSDRAQELDQALNSVLGLENESPGTEPPRASLGEPARYGGSVLDAGTQDVDEDMLSSDELFASLPRATPADEVNRESTRFFVAAAGVNKQIKRRRIGMISAMVALVVMLGFVGAWATGLLSIRLPGIGDPFANMRQGRAMTEDGPAAELSDKELALLKGQPKKRRRSRKMAAGRADGAAGGLEGLGSDYVDDSDSGRGRSGPRGTGRQERIGIGPLATGGVDEKRKLPEAVLPTSNPDLPALEGASLSQEAVAKVVKQNSMSVRFCYQQSLKGSQNLRGKLQIKLRVEPTGKVSRTTVQTSQFKGTTLASCISDKIRKWVFPPFEGDAKEFLVPFVLEKSF